MSFTGSVHWQYSDPVGTAHPSGMGPATGYGIDDCSGGWLMAESWQERKKTRKARKKAAEAQAAANMRLVAQARAIGKLPREPEPEKPQVPIIGRQRGKKRYNLGRTGIGSGKRIPKRVTAVVSGGLPGLGKK